MRRQGLYEEMSPENLRLRFFSTSRRSAALAADWACPAAPRPLGPDIPTVPGAKRAMEQLDVRKHATFRGGLEEVAKGRVARMIIRATRAATSVTSAGSRTGPHGSQRS
ncbi:hypothetical protein [Streptomyces sp. NPDC002845]